MDKELAKRTVERLHKYLRDNYGSEDVAQLETFVRSLVVSDGRFIADAGMIFDAINDAYGKQNDVLVCGSVLYDRLPRVVDDLKEERRKYLIRNIHFEEILSTPEERDQASTDMVWYSRTTDSDRKILRFLNKPKFPQDIEHSLNKRYSQNTGVSPDKWVDCLLQYSNVAKGYDKSLVIDPSNERFMRDWAKEYKPTSKAAIKSKATFKDIIQYPDKDNLLERLHFLIDGKKGKSIGIVLVRAKYIDHFLIRYPTKDEFESVFKYQGTWNAISNYFYKEEDNNVLADASNIVIF